MPQPTLSDVHVNIALTNLSVAFRQDEATFVADKVFPIVPVDQQSNVYFTYTRGDWNRNTMKKRAPGTESAGTGFGLDKTGTYSADIWSLHHDIPDAIRANADAVLNMDADATRFLIQQALITKEVNWATTFFATSVWTTQWAGQAASPGANQFLQWNDPSSTPIEDIRGVKQLVQVAGGGFRPNVLVLGRPVFDKLCDHPDLIDRVKYGQTPGQPAMAAREAMAQIFELDEVLVMDAVYNTAAEGATESNSFIGGKSALLAYRSKAPGIMTPSAGYTFAWTGLYGATEIGNRIKSFYMPWIESTRVEIDDAYALTKIGADLGGFFATAVA